VFGPAPNGIKYDEYDRYNSTNPYSASKAGGEELAVAFRNTYDLPIVITHKMNIFGNRQHPEKYIPNCIRKIANGEIIDIHSDETRTVPGSRHYIHGDDVADGVMFVLKNYELFPKGNDSICPKFNLVGPEEVNNLELAQMIADVMGKQLNYNLVDFHSSRPGHDVRYAISGDRLANMGWTPKESLRQRISEVVEWTLNNKMWM
jgi:dTDP-glucose 4,6-dehydratase